MTTAPSYEGAAVIGERILRLAMLAQNDIRKKQASQFHCHPEQAATRRAEGSVP